jgi:hypothetical protein
MTLGEKQRLFSRLLPKLLHYIHGQGYDVALAEGYVGLSVNKPTEDTPHLRSGGHFQKIAQDLDLFHLDPETGRIEYLRETDAHQTFGEYWESLHPLCRWGGRFADGNHYSLEHDGVQ